MRKAPRKVSTLLFPALILPAFALSACGSSGLLDRDRPDEFAVSRQAPLVIPPDFALTPPQVGEAAPNSVNTREEVLKAMFGGNAPRSPSEAAVVGQAGEADPAIRSTVGDPGTNVVNKGTVTRDILAAPAGAGANAQATAGE